MEEKQLFGNLSVYRGQGAYLHKLEQFDKAKAAYDQAATTSPDDVQLLIGRSQVCADAMKPQQAYSDAAEALKIEPRSMNALNTQARAMYTMSDFERSIVMNYRGLRMRKKPPYFTEGLSQGLQTLEDCVGENAGDIMLRFYPLIKQQESNQIQEDDDKYVPRPHVSRIPDLGGEKRMTQMEKRKFETISRVLAMKYLGPMAYDKFFLQSLSTDRRIPSANKPGSEELKTFIDESVRTLSFRQEMLRTQRPYYTVKLAEKTSSKYLSDVKKNRLEKERKVGAAYVERTLKKIAKCLADKRIMDVMKEAEGLQVFLDSKTVYNLPEKDFYTDRLYRAVGEGYLVMHRLSYKLSEASNRRRINFLMGLSVGRPKSYDSVMANYPHKFVDINLVLKKVEETLKMCENSYMRCWLYYEMARLLNSQKNYALAKFYAKRCQSQAEEVDCTTWWLNGCFVLMAGEMQQANQNDIRIAVDEAYEWSKKLLDQEQVQAFLAKCRQVAAEIEPPSELHAIKLRECQILNTIGDEKIRGETGVLFKRISTLPIGRRFSVLPRKVVPSSVYKPERHRRKQRDLTVVQGPPQTLPAPPRSSVAGYQRFEF